MAIEVIENLKQAIIDYNAVQAADYARKVVENGLDPIEALDALTSTIREVGEKYNKGDLWLPDLVGAAEAMQAAMPIMEEVIKKTGEKQKVVGTIVVGTVFGDIHTIGKTMVSTLLTAGGFKVYDLGVNIKAGEFIKAIEEYQPDILAMSALMTMTAPEQRKVIETLEKQGMREKVKIMVGGGAITEDFAETIGADGYEPTAPGAVELAKKLVVK